MAPGRRQKRTSSSPSPEGKGADGRQPIGSSRNRATKTPPKGRPIQPDATSLDGSQDLLERLQRISEHSPSRDRYRVIEEIGRGGMGRVLRVWDEDLGRELALKELVSEEDAEEVEDPTVRERRLARFLAEARITSQLEHPSIVPVYEIAIDRRGTLFFTMPLIRGRTVQEVFTLAREGRRRWSLHEALQILLRICHAVGFAHARGVVHRDLKPSNVMVGRFHEVYVMDWGLALVRGAPEPDAITGTPAYMAPEQASGDVARIDERTDVYALGAMLYELLTGRMPHQTTLGEGRVRFTEVALAPPRPSRELDPQVPPELAAVCAKAMAQRPSDRYPTAMALADDLQAWLERRVVGAYESGRLARLRKWRQRNAKLALALQALLVSGLLFSVGLAAIQRSKRVAIAHERDDAQHSAYAALLRAAELSFQQGGDANELLEECPEELRGWAWRHLAHRADSSHLVLEHEDTVNEVSVRADGERVASASDDGRAHLWDASGAPVATLRGHEGAVQSVSFSPRNTLLATGSLDHTVRLWDATTGIPSRTLGTHEGQVRCVAFGPRGERVASGDLHGDVRVWHLDHGLVARFVPPTPSGTVKILWVDDETFLVGFDDGRVLRIDARTGDAAAEARLAETIHDMALRPDRALLGVASQAGVTWLDAPTLDERGHWELRSRVRALAWLPSTSADAARHRILIGMQDGSVADVPVDATSLQDGPGEPGRDPWRDTWNEPHRGHEGAVLSLAAHPLEHAFLSGSSDHTVRFWSRDGGALHTQRLGLPVDAVPPSLMASNMSFVDGDREDLYVGSLLEARATRFRIGAPLTAVRQHPDERRIAAARSDGDVLLVDGSNGSVLQVLHGGGNPELQLVFDPAGERLLTRGLNATVRLWDLERGVATLRIADPFDSEHLALCFAPGGDTFWLALGPGQIRIHDAADGSLRATLDDPSGREIVSMAPSPSGNLFACGSSGGTISIWDAEERRIVHVLEGHRLHASALVFLGDEAQLASASLDRTVRIWDLERGTSLMTLSADHPLVDLAYDPARDALWSVSANGELRTWRTRAR